MKDQAIFKNLEDLFVEVIDKIDGDMFITRSREGLFSSALTMWLMICQRTQQRQSLLGTLETIREGSADVVLGRNTPSRKAQRKDISLNTGGYSKARNRLEKNQVEQVTEVISESLIVKGEDRWHGKRVYLMDGTLITLAHSKETQEKYPPNSNQHRTAHQSQLRCMCFHELFSGVALSPVYGAVRGTKTASEQVLALKMMGKLPETGLLLGDSNFGVFNIAYEAQHQGHQVLLRLTRNRVKCFCEEAESRKNFDEAVTWVPTKSYRKKYPQLAQDAAVEGRVIKAVIKNPGCAPLPLYFFTTSPEPAHRLVKLYKERERIENDIRAIKSTIGMEMLLSKTPEMLEKELLLGVAAYNLMRAIIAEAAHKLSLAPRQISFSRACSLVRIFGNNMRSVTTKKERREILEQFYKGLKQSKLPNRPKYRVEPRKVVHVVQQFPQMKKTREEERSQARETLKQEGHRGYITSVSRKY